MGYSFQSAAMVLLYALTTAFVTQIVDHWLEREIARTTEMHLAPECLGILEGFVKAIL